MSTASFRAPLLTRVPLREDVVRGAWWLALGGAAGALVGLVVGGVGGRLAMLVLRLTSPDFVGQISDDGFEIGRVTAATFQLFGATMQIGALAGIGYVAARWFVPARWRLAAWTVVGGALGGSALVHSDGIDFALEPRWLAVSSFVVLPAVGGLAIAWLVERWSRSTPWRRSAGTFLGAIAAVGALLAFALTLPLALAALAGARLAPLRWLAREHGRIVAALVLAAVVAAALANLVRDVRLIL